MEFIGTGCPSYYNYNNGSVNNAIPGADVSNSPLSRFFQKYLLQRALSVFKWELPKNWSREYFLYLLYSWGYVAVINTDKFGVIPQGCGLRGFDVFYRPTHAVIANPLLKGIVEPHIGTQCVIIKLQPDYGNVMDIVTFYGDMMALTAQTAGVNIMNSKLSYVFTTANKAGAESFKALYSKINKGEPAAYYDKELLGPDGKPAWQTFSQNVGQNYIADKLLEDLRKLENRFDTAIGIPNSNTDKKERLIVDEVNSNNAETASLCELWLEQLQEGVAAANEMFGLKLSVSWRVNPVKKEVAKNDIV